MTDKPTLTARKREGFGKGAARKLRASGQIPAVVYGQDMASLSLVLDAHETEHLFHAISTENTIVGLKVEGRKGPLETLIREIQAHPVRGDVLHVDFLRVKSDVAVELDIPVQLVGNPVGVRDHGASLEQVAHEIRVKCLPGDIPEVIELDVSGLDVGDSLHVSDVSLPDVVEILADPESLICGVEIRRIAPLVEEVEVEELVEVEGEEEAVAAEEEEPETTEE